MLFSYGSGLPKLGTTSSPRSMAASPGSLVVSTKQPHVVDGVVWSVLCTLIVWVGVISATHHPRVYTL